MEPADRRQLERASLLVQDVLGEDLVGTYLFGSAVLGGLRPESDLDLLVVSKRALTEQQRRELVGRLLEISGRPAPEGRWRRLEVTVVVESEIRPWRYPPRFDLQYGDWLRGEFERGNLAPWPSTTSPDLAVLLTMALLADAPVLGPPPAEVFDPVPPADLVRASVGAVDILLADLEDDTRNVILTLARIWSTVATGVVRSKDAAADWALARLPEERTDVLRIARDAYLGVAEERWDDVRAEVRAHADHVRSEIDRLVAG